MQIIDLFVKFLYRVQNKIKFLKLKTKFKNYISQIDERHPFYNIPKILTGDTSANPHEFFSHYESYSFWLAKKVKNICGVRNSHTMGGGIRILDVGNLKVTNALLSIENDITSLVLMDCEDKISNVNYVIHDIANKLPFDDESFDLFTSLATLHLVGLGRYGDKLDAETLLKFMSELNRVMKKTSDAIISISYGKNCLTFNEGYKFDIDTIKSIFNRNVCDNENKWEIVDWLIDNNSSHTKKNYTERFTKDLSLEGWELGEYRVIFLHLRRNG